MASFSRSAFKLMKTLLTSKLDVSVALTSFSFLLVA